MKREDLKTKLIEGGCPAEKVDELVDYIMAQNGTDLNSVKSELETLKGKYADDTKAKDEVIKGYEDKLKGFSDYEDLKKFKADTEANAEKSKRVEFLKAQGCKHPELIMTQLDFEKASYDEEKKTYTGLDESLKQLKGQYKDLFVEAATQQVEINPQPKANGSDFYEQYKKDHPELKGL